MASTSNFGHEEVKALEVLNFLSGNYNELFQKNVSTIPPSIRIAQQNNYNNSNNSTNDNETIVVASAAVKARRTEHLVKKILATFDNQEEQDSLPPTRNSESVLAETTIELESILRIIKQLNEAG